MIVNDPMTLRSAQAMIYFMLSECHLQVSQWTPE